MAASRKLERRAQKQQKVKLTAQQKRDRAEIDKREKSLNAKKEALQAEQDELMQLRRKAVMRNVKQFVLDTKELDAFVSALDGFQQNNDLAKALVNAAQTMGVDMIPFNTKLVRMGFI